MPLKPEVAGAKTYPEAIIVLGDAASGEQPLRFGSFLAFPDGRRSALTVLGEELVSRGILCPGAH